MERMDLPFSLELDPIGCTASPVSCAPNDMSLMLNVGDFVELTHQLDIVELYDMNTAEAPCKGSNQQVEVQGMIRLCSMCNKPFKHLKKHMLTHSGEKPFSCADCGASFSQKSNLNRHVKSKHVKDRIVCLCCGKSFSRNDKLKKHLQTHPNNSANNPAA